MTDRSPPPGASMLDYYAARATYYDDVYRQPERQQDLAFLHTWLPQRLSGRRVLEVACGTGYWTQFLAPAASELVAIDAAAEPLALARQRPAAASVRFMQADAYALAPDLGQFDGAFAGLWLSHVPVAERPRFLNSLHARLRPGARVIFLDNSDVQCRDYPIVARDADGNSYQDRRLKDGSVHRVLKNFPAEAQLRALVRPFAVRTEYRPLQNFWLLEYECTP